MRKMSSTVLKIASLDGGAIKKMVFVQAPPGLKLGKKSHQGLLLAVITDGACGFYLYEVLEKELRLVTSQKKLHDSR